MALLVGDNFTYYATLAQVWKIAATQTGGAALTIQAGAGRNGFNALQPSQTGGTAFVRRLLPASGTHFFIGLAMKRTVAATTDNAANIWALFENAGTTKHVDIRHNINGSINLTRNGTVLATSPVHTDWSVYHHFEFEVVVSDTAGLLVVRMDGNPTPWWSTATNLDTRNAGTGICDTLQLGSEVTATVTPQYCDLTVADNAGALNNSFLGDCRIDDLHPDADGDDNQFTIGGSSPPANRFQAVDEQTPNDAVDYVFASVVGNRQLFGVGNLASTGGNVKGLIAVTRAQKSDAGTRAYKPVVKHGGILGYGTEVFLSTSFGTDHNVFETNPSTSTVWTPSEVNAVQIGSEVTT